MGQRPTVPGLLIAKEKYGITTGLDEEGRTATKRDETLCCTGFRHGLKATNCDKLRRGQKPRAYTPGIYTIYTHFRLWRVMDLKDYVSVPAQFQAETGGSDARFEARARVGSGGVREDVPAGDDRGEGIDVRALCGEQVGDYGVASPQELVKINLGELMIKGGDAAVLCYHRFIFTR